MPIKSSIVLYVILLFASYAKANYSYEYLEACRENSNIIAIGKAEDYNKAHIFASARIWRPDYANKAFKYDGMMATRDSIEILLGKLGIRSDKKIILYDYKGGCDAARFWWILRCYGHHDVEILEGDERVWEMTYEITNKQEHRFSTDYKFPNEIDYSLSADLTGLISGMKRKAVLLDVRTKEEYTGERMKDGAFRAGHIPGAIFCPWTEAINAKGNKKLKSKRELAKMYANLGLSKDDEIVVYCHSGVRSAHTTFVLTNILGYTNVKNYDGSWIEYSFNKDLPIETGGLEKPKIEPLPLSNSVWLYPLIIVLIAVVIAVRRKRKR